MIEWFKKFKPTQTLIPFGIIEDTPIGISCPNYKKNFYPISALNRYNYTTSGVYQKGTV
ncbi:hypothetical protein Hanom_Chr12g01099831 [Helianthus anomalus]